ncbi:MAG TPA: hypothetical protein VEJ63_15740 [Planctomycetota bacterium]|nr:hypothetical protein [Planctomycetota bacterium]
MAENSDETPNDSETVSETMAELATVEPTPDRRMFVLFAIVVGVSMLGILWLAVRASTPDAVRDSMDFVLQTGMGALVAYAGFRALVLYPFRFFDLFVIVATLALFMSGAIQTIEAVERSGYFEAVRNSSMLGVTVQICCIAASILLAGAALGLRHCLLLKIESTPKRMLTVFSGMLALPGAAGFFVFPVLVLGDALSTEGTSPDTPAYLLFWLISVIAVVVDCVCLVKTMALTHEIQAQEKMP